MFVGHYLLYLLQVGEGGKINAVMISVLFSDITPRLVVVLYRHFGTTYRPKDFLKIGADRLSRNVGRDFLTLEDGADRLSRKVGRNFLTLEDGDDRLPRNVGT
jgi:hypothetical protein